MAKSRLRHSAICLWVLVLLGVLLYVKAAPHKCPWPCVCSDDHKAYCNNVVLKSLPRKLPSNLQYVNLNENLIRRIKPHRLRSMATTLKHLQLRKNRINYVHPESFRNMTKLTSLSLRDNRIRHLEKDTFSGLVNLAYLSIQNNRLRKIADLFTGLEKLYLLNLGENRIRRLTDKTFSSNRYLRILDLHNNSIFYVHRDTFKPLVYLKYLVLRDNPLGHLDLNFDLNRHLELLDLTNCRLKEVVKGLPYSINDLRLSENNITELRETDFNHTRKIRLLVLNKNKISRIENNTFSPLHQIWDIYIGGNRLRHLPPMFPKTLRGLYANWNELTQLDKHTFKNSVNLENLYLKQNKISSLDQRVFDSQRNLKRLDISFNNLFFLKPLVFHNMQKLELLDVSNNPIQDAEHDCFKGLSNLHILQMSSVGNDTQMQPSIFKGMDSLQFLDLHNSSQMVRHLAENPYILDYISSVKDLNLMEDNLHGLPPDFPNHFHQLRVIKLVNNPWHCDRSIYWLTMWMRNATVDFFAKDLMVCASPPELKGRLIMSLKEDELPPVLKPKLEPPKVKVIHIEFTHTHQLNDSMASFATKSKKLTSKEDVVKITKDVKITGGKHFKKLNSVLHQRDDPKSAATDGELENTSEVTDENKLKDISVQGELKNTSEVTDENKLKDISVRTKKRAHHRHGNHKHGAKSREMLVSQRGGKLSQAGRSAASSGEEELG